MLFEYFHESRALSVRGSWLVDFCCSFQASLFLETVLLSVDIRPSAGQRGSFRAISDSAFAADHSNCQTFRRENGGSCDGVRAACPGELARSAAPDPMNTAVSPEKIRNTRHSDVTRCDPRLPS